MMSRVTKFFESSFFQSEVKLREGDIFVPTTKNKVQKAPPHHTYVILYNHCIVNELKFSPSINPLYTNEYWINFTTDKKWYNVYI